MGGGKRRWPQGEQPGKQKWFSGAESTNGIVNVRSGAMNQGSGIEPVA